MGVRFGDKEPSHCTYMKGQGTSGTCHHESQLGNAAVAGVVIFHAAFLLVFLLCPGWLEHKSVCASHMQSTERFRVIMLSQRTKTCRLALLPFSVQHRCLDTLAVTVNSGRAMC